MAGLEGGGDKPPRLWPCHMLSEACLANPEQLGLGRQLGLGSFLQFGLEGFLVQVGLGPQKNWAHRPATRGGGGVGCSQLAPPALVPTSTPPPLPGGQSAHMPSLAVLRHRPPLTSSIHLLPELLPITCNCGGTCHPLRHLGGSRAGIIISQMRKQTAQQGVHLAGGHSALLQGWPGPPFQTGCT